MPEHVHDGHQQAGAAGGRERSDDHVIPIGRADDSGEASSGRVHRVKSWPHLFEATLTGAKTHEMRRLSDRDYRVGDVLLLQEWDPKTETYSGRELAVAITYVTDARAPCALSGEGLHEDFCILSIRPASGIVS